MLVVLFALHQLALFSVKNMEHNKQQGLDSKDKETVVNKSHNSNQPYQ